MIPLVFLLALAGCSDWPQVESTGRAQTGWPELLPLEQISTGAVADRSAEGNRLARRAAGLRARARLMRQSLNDEGAIDRLRAQLRR